MLKYHNVQRLYHIHGELRAKEILKNPKHFVKNHPWIEVKPLDPQDSKRYRFRQLNRPTKEAYEKANWKKRIEIRADKVASELGVWSLALSDQEAFTLNSKFIESAFRPQHKEVTLFLKKNFSIRRMVLLTIMLVDEAKISINRNPQSRWEKDKLKVYISTPYYHFMRFFDQALIVDNNLILDSKPKGENIYEVTYVIKTRGYNFNVATGHLIGNYLVPEESLEEAKNKLPRVIKNRVANKLVNSI